MGVPAECSGVWARVSIAVGEQPAGETQHVRWLQSSQRYCDVRVPHEGLAGPTMAFGGSCTATEVVDEARPPAGTARLHWSHELELEREPGPDSLAGVDQGFVWWRDGDLIEQGVVGEPAHAVPYTEVWRRQDPGDGPTFVLESVGGAAQLVVIGAHCLALVDDRGVTPGGAFVARYQVRRDGAWVTELELGDTSHLPDPPEAAHLALGAEIAWADRTWHVVEMSTAAV